MTEVRLGDKRIPFIYQGNKLLHPNPVKDGLILWYDFSGMSNADASRGVAKDLSGNGNHGTLQNFNYTDESGYGRNKLRFDGVDDSVLINNKAVSNNFTNEMEFSIGFTANSLSPNQTQYIFRSSELNILKHYNNLDLNVLTTSGLSHNYSIGFRWNENVVLNWWMNAFKEYYVFYLNGVEVVRDEYRDGGILNLSGESRMQESLSTGNYIGKLMSFYFYNRPLTPEEIAHNYAIEKERFGIE